MPRVKMPRERPLLMDDDAVLLTEAGAKTVARRLAHPSMQGRPYGVQGDRLWLRHAFCPRYFDDGRTAYRCDWHVSGDMVPPPRWMPSIRMRREHARTVVEVVSARVERLHCITEEDARREGVLSDAEMVTALAHLRGADAVQALPSRLRSAREIFFERWDRTVGKAWSGGRSAVDPSVWRIEYRVVVCKGERK